MKKNKYHIILTWMLLFCFVAGQYIVYAHTHSAKTGTTQQVVHQPDIQHKQTVSENCRLCDAMHHNAMAVNSPVYFAPVVVTAYYYKIVRHHFISAALVLSAGRSPPRV